jgi:very-short-patch-repair endonuclease
VRERSERGVVSNEPRKARSFSMSVKINSPSKRDFRKILRNSSTPAEAVLWKCLQRRQLLGQKFRRQISIDRYIVDFYCPEKNLVIELDGDGHFSPNGNNYDDERTKFLEKQGLTVIRFENDELKENLDGVLETIKAYLE